MRASNVLAEEKLYHFLDKYGNTREKRELLLFFGSNPNAKFSKLAIFYALDCNRLKFNRALGVMVEQGILDMYLQNDMPLYSLTTNNEIRRNVVELADVSLDRWFCL